MPPASDAPASMSGLCMRAYAPRGGRRAPPECPQGGPMFGRYRRRVCPWRVFLTGRRDGRLDATLGALNCVGQNKNPVGRGRMRTMQQHDATRQRQMLRIPMQLLQLRRMIARGHARIRLSDARVQTSCPFDRRRMGASCRENLQARRDPHALGATASMQRRLSTWLTMRRSASPYAESSCRSA